MFRSALYWCVPRRQVMPCWRSDGIPVNGIIPRWDTPKSTRSVMPAGRVARGAWLTVPCTSRWSLALCVPARSSAHASDVSCAEHAIRRRVRWVVFGQSTAIPRPCKPSPSNTDAAKRNAGRCCATFSVRVADPKRTRTDQPECKRKALPPRI